MEQITPAAERDIAENELQLGEALIHQGRLAEAQTYINGATYSLKALDDPNKIGSSLYEFGQLYAAQGDYSLEAEQFVLAAGDDYTALKSSHGHDVVGAFFCALVGYSKGRPDAPTQQNAC